MPPETATAPDRSHHTLQNQSAVVRSVSRDHRSAEAVVEARGRLIDGQPRARGARGKHAAKAVGNVESGGAVAEVGVAILAGHAPVVAERPFDAAADGPAPARGR